MSAAGTTDRPRLRRAADADLARTHALLSIPEVNHYLADAKVPPPEAIAGWIEQSHRDFARCQAGLWLLEDGAATLAGCVLLEADAEARSAELTYALAPRCWRRGLATAMSVDAILSAFEGGAIDRVVAGADVPNEASIAVMRRLGMRFLRDVVYPLHPGVEYVLYRGDPFPPVGLTPLALA